MYKGFTLNDCQFIKNILGLKSVTDMYFSCGSDGEVPLYLSSMLDALCVQNLNSLAPLRETLSQEIRRKLAAVDKLKPKGQGIHSEINVSHGWSH